MFSTVFLEKPLEVLTEKVEKALEPLACGLFLFLVGGLEHVMFVYVWAPLHLNQNSYVLSVKYLYSTLFHIRPRWDFSIFLDSPRIVTPGELDVLKTDISKGQPSDR